LRAAWATRQCGTAAGESPSLGVLKQRSVGSGHHHTQARGKQLLRWFRTSGKAQAKQNLLVYGWEQKRYSALHLGKCYNSRFDRLFSASIQRRSRRSREGGWALFSVFRFLEYLSRPGTHIYIRDSVYLCFIQPKTPKINFSNYRQAHPCHAVFHKTEPIWSSELVSRDDKPSFFSCTARCCGGCNC
jgi:hypothetical protein